MKPGDEARPDGTAGEKRIDVGPPTDEGGAAGEKRTDDGLDVVVEVDVDMEDVDDGVGAGTPEVPSTRAWIAAQHSATRLGSSMNSRRLRSIGESMSPSRARSIRELVTLARCRASLTIDCAVGTET